MKMRRLNSALADVAMLSMRAFAEPATYTKLLTLDGVGDTLMGGAASSETNTSQTGDTAPVGDVKPAEQQTPPAVDAAKAAADAKAAEDAKAADDAKARDGAAALKAPEKYAFTMPEGVSMDAEILGEFEGIARELDLPQETAQKLADMGLKLQTKFVADQTAVLERAAGEWLEQSRSDKEFGGDNLAENVATAVKARDTFASPALRDMLQTAKLTDHPEVIRMFWKVGKAISEDRMVNGGSGPTADKTTANVLYPNQK